MRLTQIDHLLEVLGDEDWHSSQELDLKLGRNFRQTLKKATEKGYQIEKSWFNRRFHYRIDTKY
jgi:hypothetical protein